MALIMAAAALFIYFFQASVWSESGRFSNIKLYIFGITVFFIVFIIGSLIEQTIIKNIKMNLYVKLIGIMLLVDCCGYFLFSSFYLEIENWPYAPAEYLRHNIPAVIYFVVITMSVITAFQLIKRSRSKNRRGGVRVIFSGVIILLQTWFMYAPNFFKDNCGTLYHMDAYTNSIINALNFSPFEQYSASIYGHYGIFYIIPVKILQWTGLNQWISVTLTIALIGGIAFGAEYWVMSQIIHNDMVFMLAVLANSIVSTQIYYNQVYQILPHRFVFQAVMLAGLFFVCKREGGKRKILKTLMWGVAGAAVVWNTETGIVIAFVWMLGSLYLNAEECGKYTIRLVINNMGLFIAAVAGAYGFVNLYNLLVGGNAITFATFIYPLGSKSYPVENIQCTLQIPWAGYFLPILLMLCIIGHYLLKTITIRLNTIELIVILAAVMGIGVYTYYMNRAVSTNASIISFTFVLVAAFLVDRNFDHDNDFRKKGLTMIERAVSVSPFNICSGFLLIVIVSMTLSTVAAFGITLKGKIDTTYETESLDQFVREIKTRVPNGTVAFGIGTAQLFSYMDLRTGIYMADWEDLDQSLNGGETVINQEAIDYLQQQLKMNKYPYILTYEKQSGYIPAGYAAIDNFEYNGFSYILYVNTQPV